MRGEILKLETHGQTQYLWMGMTKCRGLAGLERPCVVKFHHSLSCQRVKNILMGLLYTVEYFEGQTNV